MLQEAYLNDKEFLQKLDQQHIKDIYARITALSFQEEPLERIEGRVTSGSINIDGSSTVRRSCSLTLLTATLENINDFYWSVKNKFRLEIGLSNKIDSRYPDIIWFKQGIYVISSFNFSYQANNYSISISGKDKMCLLNGELGGALFAQHDFGQIEDYKSTYVIPTIMSRDLYISPMISFYKIVDGQYVKCDKIAENYDPDETYYTIEEQRTITKLPILEILREGIHTYAGEPYHNIVLNDIEDAGLEQLDYKGDNPMYVFRNVATSNFDQITMTKPSWITDNWVYDNLLNNEGITPSTHTVGGTTYTVAKLEYGDVAGYRLTPLVYPKELILNVGEAFTNVLDKIREMLGDFEYFYDVDGRFIFQKKKSQTYTVWNNLTHNEEEIVNEIAALTSNIIYTFQNNILISSFQNTPAINQIRNDYSIWGARESVSGESIPIHARYAIDIKPTSYWNHEGTIEYTTADYDWRELIYQMASDYMQYHMSDSDDYDEYFSTTIEGYNPWIKRGLTGYEQYYTDIFSFWRDLYNPYDTTSGEYYPASAGDKLKYWNKKVFEAPDTLNFWFDFFDSGDLARLAVPVIGDRVKATRDEQIKSLYYKEIPNIIYTDPESYEQDSSYMYKPGYVYARLTTLMSNYFKISTQGKSAKDEIEQQLYNYAYCTENISITSIPVYYLEPNIRIHVYDKNTNIDGDYLISKITLPLSYNGTMSVQATKAPQYLL